MDRKNLFTKQTIIWRQHIPSNFDISISINSICLTSLIQHQMATTTLQNVPIYGKISFH